MQRGYEVKNVFRQTHMPIFWLVMVCFTPITSSVAGESVEVIEVGERSAGDFVLWTQDIGHAAAAIARAEGAEVIIATNQFPNPAEIATPQRIAGGAVLCFESQNGTVRWGITHAHQDRDDSIVRSFAGVTSRPTIDGDRVFYVSNRGELICLDLEGLLDEEDDGLPEDEHAGEGTTADVVWRLDMISELGVFRVDSAAGNPHCSPFVWEDIVFCVTGNGSAFGAGPPAGEYHVRAPNAPSFIAVKRESGDVLWSSKAPGKNLVYSWSSPVVWTGGSEPVVIFPGGDGVLYCFAARTGELKAQIDLNKADATYWARGRGTRCFFIAPLVIEQNTIYAGLATDLYGKTFDAPLVAVSLRERDGLTASVAWSFHDRDFDCTYSRAIVHGPLVFTASEDTGSVFAIDRATGKRRKSLVGVIGGPRVNGFPSMCITADGLLWIPTPDGLLGVTADEQMNDTAVLEFDQPLIGSPLESGGVLYVPTKSRLYALDYTKLRMRIHD